MVIINRRRNLHYRRISAGLYFVLFRLRVFLVVYDVTIHNEVWPNEGAIKLVLSLTMTNTGKRTWRRKRYPSYILSVGD